MRQSKRDYLRAITNGTLNYYSCDDTSLDISVDGMKARMTGRSRVMAAVFGGGTHMVVAFGNCPQEAERQVADDRDKCRDVLKESKYMENKIRLNKAQE